MRPKTISATVIATVIAAVAAVSIAASPAIAATWSAGTATSSSTLTAKPAASQYSATVREASPLAGYTVYRPLRLPTRTTLPVVVWGNGGCRASNEEFQTFLSQIAAHGFYVIAAGRPEARFTDATGADTSPAVLTKAVAWVSSRPHSRTDVRRQLDPRRIAVMGQSCGGVQALAAGGDPRVKSVAAWNGSSGLGASSTSVLNALHAPTLWVTGGTTDVAYKAANADYAAVPSTVPAALVQNSAAGHVGIYHGTNDPTAAAAGAPVLSQTVEVQGSTLAVAWLDATLNRNRAAGRYFLGPDCGICSEPLWSARSKGWPAAR